MPSIQSLKKELRGIRSTWKLTKAMRTVSAAKFSKLNALFGQYEDYSRLCKELFFEYQTDFLEAIRIRDESAPPVYVVMASNKGLCGSFNAEVFKFACDELASRGPYKLIACGREAVRYFRGKGYPLLGGYILRDVPSFEESGALLKEVLKYRSAGEVSGVYVIYPKYLNMLNQKPAVCELFPAPEARKKADAAALAFCVPDKKSLIVRTAETVFGSMFYELVLETALGAQAATLMTMRAAYDAATDFCEELEGEINRKRQGAVTADVIETSSGEAAFGGEL